jgi:hypothetical protein
MKPKTIEEKVEYYAMLHKQNLNGRETEDELFEAGILAGIEETLEEKDEFAIEFAEWCRTIINRVGLLKYKSEFMYKTTKELLEIFKKEKGYE